MCFPAGSVREVVALLRSKSLIACRPAINSGPAEAKSDSINWLHFQIDFALQKNTLEPA